MFHAMDENTDPYLNTYKRVRLDCINELSNKIAYALISVLTLLQS